MKAIILSIFFALTFINYSYCSDNYKIGDELYVWASNGLNLRKGPGTNFKVINKLEFGTLVKIEQKTNLIYNINGISKTSPNYYSIKVDPIIFKGNWVKVTTQYGKIGYLIDQYLMKLNPIEDPDIFSYELNLKTISIDTLSKKLIPNEGGLFEVCIKKKYEGDIAKIETSGGYYAETVYIFENYTIEEVLILLSSSLNDFKDFVVLKYWKEEIEFSDNELCTFNITKQKNSIRVIIFCSC